MSIIGLIVLVLLAWLVHSYAPFPPPIKVAINIVLGLVFLIVLLQMLGLLAGLNPIRIR